MIDVYLDADVIRELIRSGTYDAVKEEAARQGKQFVTTDIILQKELADAAKGGGPEHEAIRKWLENKDKKFEK